MLFFPFLTYDAERLILSAPKTKTPRLSDNRGVSKSDWTTGQSRTSTMQAPKRDRWLDISQQASLAHIG
jgi:hypothetical protein